MTYYVLLLCCLLVLSAVAFRLSGYELLAPLAITPLLFAFVTVLAMIGRLTWNKVDLQFDGFLIVLLGCVTFVVGGFVMQHFAFKTTNEKTSETAEAVSAPFAVHVATWKYLVLIALLIIGLCLFVHDTYRLAHQMGINTSNYFTLTKKVHAKYAAYYSTADVRFGQGYSVITRQFGKLAYAGGFAGAVLLALGVKARKVKDGLLNTVILPAIMVLLACMFTISMGQRSWILRFALATLISCFIYDCVCSGKNAARVSWNYIRVLVPVGLLVFVLFYYAGTFIGRASGNIVEYTSFYFGGGLPTLQQGISGTVPIKAVGLTTFYGINVFLYKFGLLDSLPGSSIFWVNLGGHKSNIPTAFFCYYYDFGYVGVLIFGLLQGAIFCAMYLYVKRKRNVALLAPFTLIYAFMIDLVREEFIFSRMISSNIFLTLLLLFIVTYWLNTPVIQDLKTRLARIRGAKQK